LTVAGIVVSELCENTNTTSCYMKYVTMTKYLHVTVDIVHVDPNLPE